MFDHFAFGAQALRSNITTDPVSMDTLNIAYTDLKSRTLEGEQLQNRLRQGEVDNFVRHFSIQPTSSSSYDRPAVPQPIWSPPPPPPTTHDEMILSPPSSTTSISTSLHNRPSRGQTVTSRRLQRQLNLQLQHCTTHMRALESLVENMILSNSQCVLHPSPPLSRPNAQSQPNSSPSQPQQQPQSPPIIADNPNHNELIVDDAPPPPTPEGISHSTDLIPLHEDEGFAEMDVDESSLLEEATGASRRTDSPHSLRTTMLLSYKRSAEYATAMHEQGRLLVRNRPRMKRRRVKRAGE